DRLIANVTDREFDDLPRVGPLRRKMLKDAIAFYERIPLQPELSADTRYRLAGIWRAIAGRSAGLDELDQWQYAFGKAESAFTDLIAEYPERQQYRGQLAIIQRDKHDVCRRLLRDFSEDEKACRKAIELYKDLIRREPQEASWVILLIHSWRDLAEPLRVLG